ncbi:MAG TPA: AAA family ATPase [Nitrososphaerales archaeon]|nr:AAA family ATPase [Nitrososphaerales archaeon]
MSSFVNDNHPDNQKEQKVHSAEASGVRLNITLSRTKQKDKPVLLEKLHLENYDLRQGQTFDERIKALTPHGTPEYIDRGEKYVERIMRAMYHFKQCALIGPSGTGKTHIVYLVAEIAGLPLWEINCGLQTSAYDLFGRYVGLGKENWIDGQIVSWCRYGGILYLDEANMMKQDVATRLNPVLDTRGHLVLTEKDNEIIPRHPAGYVVISLNPYSAEFAGTKPLNAAFRRRMSVWIDFDYLSVGNKVSEDEITLVEKKGKVSRSIATGVVRVGAELRRQYKSNELPYGPSVGDLINWSLLASDGVAPEVAAEETVISMTSDNAEVQDMVRRVVRMIFGGSSSDPSNVETKTESTNEKEAVAPEIVSHSTYKAPTGESSTGGFSDSLEPDSGF